MWPWAQWFTCCERCSLGEVSQHACSRRRSTPGGKCVKDASDAPAAARAGGHQVEREFAVGLRPPAGGIGAARVAHAAATTAMAHRKREHEMVSSV